MMEFNDKLLVSSKYSVTLPVCDTMNDGVCEASEDSQNYNENIQNGLQMDELDHQRQSPNGAMDCSVISLSPEEPLDSGVIPSPPGMSLGSGTIPQPQEEPLDNGVVPEAIEEPLDGDVTPQPPEEPQSLERPPDNSTTSQTPEEPLGGGSQTSDEPLGSCLFPPPQEEPLGGSFQTSGEPLGSCLFPPPPEEPMDSDCCMSGCTPCVFDIYREELQKWEEKCRRIRDGTDQEDEQGVHEDGEEILSRTEYRQFTIETVTKETEETWRYRFPLRRGRSLGLRLGQHIIIRSSGGKEVITRQYTPVSEVKVTGFFELLIKIYRNGKMSRYVHTWSPGTTVELRGPFGEYSYTANKHAQLLMLAAGSGITPMAQIVHGILYDEEDDTRVRLLYTCRNYDEILMKSELDEWSHFWNFSVLYVLSREPDGLPDSQYRYGDKIHRGRLDQDLLSQELSSVDNTGILISGTKSFDKDMLNYCKKLGIQDTDVHKF